MKYHTWILETIPIYRLTLLTWIRKTNWTLYFIMFRVADGSAMAPKAGVTAYFMALYQPFFGHRQICSCARPGLWTAVLPGGLNVTVTLTVNVLPGSLSMTVTVTVSVTININSTADILWAVYVTMTDTGTLNLTLTLTLHSCITWKCKSDWTSLLLLLGLWNLFTS